MQYDWLEHAWTTHDAGMDRAADRAFPARRQGRPALHRLWAKDRGDTESRPQALNAELRS